MLGGFLESDLSLEADRHFHRLKPEKKDLNPSPIDQMIGLAVLQGDVKYSSCSRIRSHRLL